MAYLIFLQFFRKRPSQVVPQNSISPLKGDEVRGCINLISSHLSPMTGSLFVGLKTKNVELKGSAYSLVYFKGHLGF